MKYLDFSIDYAVASLAAWIMTTYFLAPFTFVELLTIFLISAVLMGQKKQTYDKREA